MSKQGQLREKRADKDLIQAAKHVGYEIDMMVCTAQMLGSKYSSPQTTLADAHWNMALESFLIHFRNLRSFLCPLHQNITPDDVIASDFLNEQEPRDVGNWTRLGTDKERLDKMLAHISYRREEYVTPGQSTWWIADLTVAALDEFESFLAQLPEKKADWLPSRGTVREYRVRIPGSGSR